MALPLNLEEQEQVDALKRFWARFGSLITWALVFGFVAMAAWNGWSYWQRTQAVKALAVYDEIERAVVGKDTDRVLRGLTDMQSQFRGTALADQGGFLAAKFLAESGKTDAARSALQWVSEQSKDEAYRAVARLRLAALYLDAKAYDQALSVLQAPVPKVFDALLADRRGDIYKAQGKNDEARQQYKAAWLALDDRLDYRKLVAVKLTALGVDTATLAAPSEKAR